MRQTGKRGGIGRASTPPLLHLALAAVPGFNVSAMSRGEDGRMLEATMVWLLRERWAQAEASNQRFARCAALLW
jgi:hypothetical protein